MEVDYANQSTSNEEYDLLHFLNDVRSSIQQIDDKNKLLVERFGWTGGQTENRKNDESLDELFVLADGHIQQSEIYLNTLATSSTANDAQDIVKPPATGDKFHIDEVHEGLKDVQEWLLHQGLLGNLVGPADQPNIGTEPPLNEPNARIMRNESASKLINASIGRAIEMTNKIKTSLSYTDHQANRDALKRMRLLEQEVQQKHLSTKRKLVEVERAVIARRRAIRELDIELRLAEKDVAQKAFRLQLQAKLQERLSSLVKLSNEKEGRIEYLTNVEKDSERDRFTLHLIHKGITPLMFSDTQAWQELCTKVQTQQAHHRGTLIRQILRARECELQLKKILEEGNTSLHSLSRLYDLLTAQDAEPTISTRSILEDAQMQIEDVRSHAIVFTEIISLIKQENNEISDHAAAILHKLKYANKYSRSISALHRDIDSLIDGDWNALLRQHLPGHISLGFAYGTLQTLRPGQVPVDDILTSICPDALVGTAMIDVLQEICSSGNFTLLSSTLQSGLCKRLLSAKFSNLRGKAEMRASILILALSDLMHVLPNETAFTLADDQLKAYTRCRLIIRTVFRTICSTGDPSCLDVTVQREITDVIVDMREAFGQHDLQDMLDLEAMHDVSQLEHLCWACLCFDNQTSSFLVYQHLIRCYSAAIIDDVEFITEAMIIAIQCSPPQLRGLALLGAFGLMKLLSCRQDSKGVADCTKFATKDEHTSIQRAVRLISKLSSCPQLQSQHATQRKIRDFSEGLQGSCSLNAHRLWLQTEVILQAIAMQRNPHLHEIEEQSPSISSQPATVVHSLGVQTNMEISRPIAASVPQDEVDIQKYQMKLSELHVQRERLCHILGQRKLDNSLRELDELGQQHSHATELLARLSRAQQLMDVVANTDHLLLRRPVGSSALQHDKAQDIRVTLLIQAGFVDSIIRRCHTHISKCQAPDNPSHSQQQEPSLEHLPTVPTSSIAPLTMRHGRRATTGGVADLLLFTQQECNLTISTNDAEPTPRRQRAKPRLSIQMLSMEDGPNMDSPRRDSAFGNAISKAQYFVNTLQHRAKGRRSTITMLDSALSPSSNASQDDDEMLQILPSPPKESPHSFKQPPPSHRQIIEGKF